jgi:hypothetical protein
MTLIIFALRQRQCNICSFLCPIAKEVWGFIAIHIGADCIPSSALQYYEWVDKFLLLNTCTPCVLSTLLGHLEGA